MQLHEALVHCVREAAEDLGADAQLDHSPSEGGLRINVIRVACLSLRQAASDLYPADVLFFDPPEVSAHVVRDFFVSM